MTAQSYSTRFACLQVVIATLSAVLLLSLNCVTTKKSPEQLRAISISVDSLLQIGDTLQALELGRSLTIMPSPNDDGTAESIFRLNLALARMRRQENRFSEAERIYKSIIEQSHGSDSISQDHQITALHELGLLFLESGDDQQARGVLEEALHQRVSFYGPDHWRCGTGYDALAIADMRNQAWTEAEERLHKSISIYENAGVIADSARVQSLMNLALVYAEMGKKVAETETIEKANAILSQVGSMSRVTQALMHNVLSDYYDRKGEYAKGLVHQEEAANLLKEEFGPCHPKSIVTRANLLVSYYLLDQMDNLKHELSSLKEDLANVSVMSTEIADACRIAGSFYLNFGELEIAKQLLFRGHDLYNQVGNPLSRDRADCLMALAQLMQMQDKPDSAFAYGQLMHEIARANFREIFDNLAESEAFAYSRQLRDVSDFYISLLREQPDSLFINSQEFAQTIVNSKSAVTDGIMSRSRILRELSEHGAQSLLDSLAWQRRQLASLYAHPNVRDNFVQSKLLSKLKSIESIQRTLADQSAQYAGRQLTSNSKINEICENLPPHAVLIEYYKYTHTDREDNRESRYAAVMLNHDGLLANVDLGLADNIDRAAHRWVDDLATPQMLNSARTERLTSDLQKLVWEPLGMDTVSASLLIISADAALSGIAFHAFRNNDSSYLIEKCAIHYVSSARDVLRAKTQTTEHNEPIFLALADPDFRFTKSSSPLASLPGSRIEVQAVAKAWSNLHHGTVELFEGAQAMESTFMEQPGRAHTIYIASHGDRGEIKPELEQELLLASQALLLAGDSSEQFDGVVTAADISGLDLSNVSLVVLSACESASGVQFDGEGNFSLRRAFQIAGAQSVVSTLWKIDDQSTTELMSSLFAQHDASLAESMRRIAMTRLAELRANGGPIGDHPYLWAGVVATGNWRN